MLWNLMGTGIISPVFCCAALALFGSAEGSEQEPPMVVSVTSIAESGDQEGQAYLNGYRATIDGQTIAYHCSHPDADTALLVRTRRDAPSITWETDPIPPEFPGEYYEFVWLAGIDFRGWGSEVERDFRLFINGQPWFTFHNRKDAAAGRWTVRGRDGAELRFESQLIDKHGDLFGYMFLRVPKRGFAVGAPLLLRVEAEDAGSPEWYMTFQYRFNFIPRLRSEPALLRDGDRGAQALRLSLDNLEQSRIVTIAVPGREKMTRELTVGANIVFIPIPAVETPEKLGVVFERDGVAVERFGVDIRPVPKRDIYLLPYSHTDIGYTDLQPEVEQKHHQHLEEALRLIAQTRGLPPEARFRWNLEVLWPLPSYMAEVSADKRRELVGAVRAGTIGLNALFVNPLTGLAGAVEMAHFLDYARAFSRAHDIPITTATISDIPGFTWGMVTALARSGVRYFSSAPNQSDRIGYVNEQWGDKPFYWRSQSGEEKILLWVVGASYASFHEGTLTMLGDEKLMRLGRTLAETGYPYDIYGLPYTLGDNGGPDTTLSAFVKDWNERYLQPRLIIATHEQLFAEFERRYGSSLPTYAGDFTPYWEDGAVSTASETAMTRRAVDRLIQGEAIWAMRAPQKYAQEAYADAWREVVLWDEHTWGADKSVSHPDDSGTIGQWRHKQRFAVNADIRSTALLAEALPSFSPKQGEAISLDVFNTTSWPRRDLILLTPEQSACGDRVVDARGNPLPSQRLTSGELAVLIDSVPPLAAARITVKPGAGGGGNAIAAPDWLENGLLSMAIDTVTGAVRSLISNGDAIEYVNDTGGLGLNQYCYVPGKNPDSAQGLRNVRVSILERGPLVASLLIMADAPGCRRFETEYRVISGIPRLDIVNRLNKSAVRSKEGVHLAFPFSVEGGRIRYDVASGIVEPERDQLAGSCKNFFSVESWVDVSGDSRGVTLVTPDAPLAEIGTITAEAPWLKRVEPSGIIYSYIMNNYWHTNYKADQEGPVEFHYSIILHGGFKPEEIVQRGREGRRPLLAAVTDPSIPQSGPLVSIDSEAVIVESIRPLPGGRSWLMSLYNPSDRRGEFRLRWGRPGQAALMMSDIEGAAGQPLEGVVTLPPAGSRFIRVDGAE